MATLAIEPVTRGTASWRFVATIFAGSFLLFLVQPMIARMALPRLGGSPSVWNSAMLVYQALLLAAMPMPIGSAGSRRARRGCSSRRARARGGDAAD